MKTKITLITLSGIFMVLTLSMMVNAFGVGSPYWEGFPLTMFKLKNEGKIVPGPVGIGSASTFMGFCSVHDNSLFEPIENNSFG